MPIWPVTSVYKAETDRWSCYLITEKYIIVYPIFIESSNVQSHVYLQHCTKLTTKLTNYNNRHFLLSISNHCSNRWWKKSRLKGDSNPRLLLKGCTLQTELPSHLVDSLHVYLCILKEKLTFSKLWHMTFIQNSQKMQGRNLKELKDIK